MDTQVHVTVAAPLHQDHPLLAGPNSGGLLWQTGHVRVLHSGTFMTANCAAFPGAASDARPIAIMDGLRLHRLCHHKKTPLRLNTAISMR